jgi:hypothetical protein
MKRILSIIVFVLVSIVISFGQTPQAIKYQAIARDLQGTPLINQDVSLRVSLLQGDREGAAVYSETQNLPTNSYGLINLEIGKGKALSGMFTDINWKNGPFFLKMEMDITGGTNYQLMGTSELLSVPYALYAEHSGDEGNRAGEWTHDATNIWVSPTYAPNNVGIGTNSPAQKLHIYNGSGVSNFLLEGTYAGVGTAGISNFYLKNSSGGALFGFYFKKESGTTYIVQSAFDGTNWIPYNKLNYSTKELEYKEGLVDVKFSNTGNVLFNNSGNIDHNYTGGGNGLNASGNTPYALYYIENNDAQNDWGWGLSAGLSNSSAGSTSIGIIGWNFGSGYGVYGYSYNGTGIYGQNYSGNYGSLGTPDYGVVGYNATSTNYGYIGTNKYGVYGYLNPLAPGQYAIYGYNPDGYAGDGYDIDHTIGGVKGYNYWGYPYTFGVAGYSYLISNRSGGCFGGYEYGGTWGSMAYKSSSSSIWGGYFTSYTSGGGKAGETAINNGIGAWGDLFGATVTGGIYGTFTRGEHYALYAHGNTFSDGMDVYLQRNRENTSTVLYSPASTSVTVQTYGFGQLSGGKCTVDFDKAFRDAVSQEEPVVVTVTPVGHCEGILLTSITSSGFSVEENKDGKSNVPFTFIAIGQRAGFENPQLPQEVIQSDYVDKIEKSYVNDASTKNDAPGLYYENGQLINGRHPSTFRDLNRPKTDPDALKIKAPAAIGKEGNIDGKDPSTNRATGNPAGAIKTNANTPDISKPR